ncbi:MAG: hypothetical protein JOZ87_31390 [Chloroflexi bacterium]|nr:hypothetical protein [Chloroflexota bacterium]
MNTIVRIQSTVAQRPGGLSLGFRLRKSQARRQGLIVPWLDDADIVAQTYGGSQGIAQRMRAATLARSRFEGTGEVE